MSLWRVKEQNYRTNKIAIKDSDYDKITEFIKISKAHHYYKIASDNNYKVVLEEQVNGKWQYRSASCCSKFINKLAKP